MNDNKPVQIDIEQIVKSKNERLGRIKPLINYMRRILHQDEINSILSRYSHLDTIDFIRCALSDMGITYELIGAEKLDPKGRYIFASNHPFGGLDGLMLAEKMSGIFGSVKVVVNDLLMNISPLKSIFIPVNKHGKQSAEYSILYNDAFASDVPVITFPAGLCSRRKGRVVCDLEWKPNFIKQAVYTKRDIVPVFFDGELSPFFYRLANLRTKLRIKANIEMVYLTNEMFKQRNSHFHIVIGSPIKWESLQDGNSAKYHAGKIKEAAYALKKQSDWLKIR